MPWKETCVMDEKLRFVARLLDGEKLSDLCLEFGISRVTGTKIRDRYLRFGASGLMDRSRRPIKFGNETEPEVVQRVLQLRQLYPTWGPKKLRVKLEDSFPGLRMPAASTIGEILDRHGLTKHRRKRLAKERFEASTLTAGTEPNDVWCVDFKGQFKLKNGIYCYPLTVSDYTSRFLIGCEALTNTQTHGAIETFEALFDEFGVPNIIRSDNGAPFSSRSFGGLSQLSVWWMRLGIRPERTDPGCPQQNGRHERMHRTLKQETTRPAAANMLKQQELFDEFKHVYNFKRPHEGLGMVTPSTLYKRSTRTLVDALKPIEYPLHDIVSRISTAGQLKIKSRTIFIGRAFSGQDVALREIANKLFLVTFASIDLGYADFNNEKFLLENPLAPERDL